MSGRKQAIKDCYEALDEYRWMLEDAVARGNKSEAESLRRDMKRVRNDLLAVKRKNRKEKRYDSVFYEEQLALALCAF